MAKTYVQINKFAVKDIFDAKHKSRMPGLMQKAAEKAVKASSKLTLEAPKEKGATGYSLDGSLESLAPDASGKKLVGKCSMAVTSWPGKSLKAMPSGTAATAIPGADKIDAGDVDAIADGAVASAMKSAISYMEKNAP
ncbi:MAG TPA: hypothetical protein VHM00_14340 [Caldimonas sp.]|nr:hypothetical protein [Caldimonas sp.]HEX2542248.1 hypothetical protein [Caldimonas sp.]